MAVLRVIPQKQCLVSIEWIFFAIKSVRVARFTGPGKLLFQRVTQLPPNFMQSEVSIHAISNNLIVATQA